MRYLILAVICIFSVSCSNSNDAKRALHGAGYTDIEITGWKPLSCDEKDFYSTGFIARNPNGNTVSGVVCSGILFKNATIRF